MEMTRSQHELLWSSPGDACLLGTLVPFIIGPESVAMAFKNAFPSFGLPGEAQAHVGLPCSPPSSASLWTQTGIK